MTDFVADADRAWLLEHHKPYAEAVTSASRIRTELEHLRSMQDLTAEQVRLFEKTATSFDQDADRIACEFVSSGRDCRGYGFL